MLYQAFPDLQLGCALFLVSNINWLGFLQINGIAKSFYTYCERISIVTYSISKTLKLIALIGALQLNLWESEKRKRNSSIFEHPPVSHFPHRYPLAYTFPPPLLLYSPRRW